MKLFDVVKGSIVTEKTSGLQIGKHQENTYVLKVSDSATKIDIKKAILEIYWIWVERVNIVHTREKFKQGRKGVALRKRSSKKAYVTLKNSNDVLDLTQIKI